MDGRQRMHGYMPVKFTGEVPAAVEKYQTVRGQSVTTFTVREQQYTLAAGDGADQSIKYQRAGGRYRLW